MNDTETILDTPARQPRFGVELGIDVPGEGRVCGADVGQFVSLSAALHYAERVRGKRLRAVLAGRGLAGDAEGACAMDADPADYGRRIVGATLYEYNDAYGTVWSHDLTEWEEGK